ncbi:hypothetical protein C4573_00725 [Candidatus Woesearchaeota archaeon]|nr:MAG: hypothetical protein C4573_00725 [Candidatus Woesearchaeota archaeon]
MESSDDRIREFEKKYKERIDMQLRNYKDSEVKKGVSRQYIQFKKDYMPTHLSLYEKWCNAAEKILNIKPDKKKVPELQEAIDICHLGVTPTGTTSLSFLAPLIIGFAAVFFGYVLPFLLNSPPSMLLVLAGLFAAVISIIPMQKMPFFLANRWRMKASNQMVLCVFYLVTYMRHTSNFENAVNFAAEHLSPPLAIDLKKVLWDVETEKYVSIKESMDNYLESWKKWNMEFIEAVHLIESSLYEGSEDRRINSLDKSLTVILEETYEKMLHYAHNLQSPLTMLHMLGIVLPILGLVILPLAVSFINGIKWYHLFAFYDILLPLGVYYLSKMILSTRPTGYGEIDISNNPELKKFKNVVIKVGKSDILIPPFYVALIIFLVFFFIGISPLIMHSLNSNFDVIVTKDGVKVINEIYDKDAKYYLLGYREVDKENGIILGPFGLGAAILSIGITLSFGIGIGMYYKLRSQNIIKIRNQTKELEKEFASALFQLGNRLGDGLPVEIAFEKVSEIMQGTTSGRFFELVTINLRKLGMGVQEAIFDPQRGALVYYPSPLIESSMKVLVESSKKGPLIASQALINVSLYIKEMHRVDERLKDLMADIISSMKSQISFLTPAIAGIVIGITSMITTILGSLGDQLTNIAADSTAASANSFSNLFQNFLGYGLPTYYFQFIVGIYVVEIVFILTLLVNGIQNGSDALNERFMLGENLITSTILYCIISLAIMLIFNAIAAQIIGSVNIAGLGS